MQPFVALPPGRADLLVLFNNDKIQTSLSQTSTAGETRRTRADDRYVRGFHRLIQTPGAENVGDYSHGRELINPAMAARRIGIDSTARSERSQTHRLDAARRQADWGASPPASNFEHARDLASSTAPLRPKLITGS